MTSTLVRPSFGKTLRAMLLGCVAASAVVFVRPAPAVTVTGGCMDDLFPGTLNCNANDIQIARATNIQITDPCSFPGDSVTFNATFQVVLTAQTRYDIGLYFATDGDPNRNGALTGTCLVSNLNLTPDPPFVNLDPAPDSCGDINSTHSPMNVTINSFTTTCIDSDGDGRLNLPNCSSWRQPGANELCTSPLQAFPGAPSKCRCDLGFNIDIPVPPATLTVVKTANPTSRNEPGGTVRFTVSIRNDSADPVNTVTITTLNDNVFGNLRSAANTAVSNNTCLTLDTSVGAGETVTCAFDAPIAGNAGFIHTDTVTATGSDNRTPPNPVSGSDDATVTITDRAPALSLTKTANPTQVLEPGGNATFSVVVRNDSLASTDPVTISSLIDDIYGSLNGRGTCAVPQTIAAGGTYSCSFVGAVTGNAGGSQTDVITATGTDDEGNSVSASDSATVDINNSPSSIQLNKTANPTTVDEPGANVTFTFQVRNLSIVDAVTINTLTDSVYGNLNGMGTCAVPQTIPAGGTYTCSITMFVPGNAGGSLTNIGTASGVDDDGQPVSDDDDATVSFRNVPPAASVTKSATNVVVTFAVTVTNDSTAEPLALSVLTDSTFGNVTTSGHDGILSTNCAVPQTIAVGGSYACSFVATVTSPHTDTVTGTVADDDGGTISVPSNTVSVTVD
jgi:uncharacterized repeat protein (TIGR01451 family)